MPPGISPKIDLFALLIFLGIAQGIFLAYFFFTTRQGNRLAHLVLGFLLLNLSFNISEVLLCYTNYMFYNVHLIDITEPFNFTIAPLVYLFMYVGLNEKLPKYWYIHFIPFIIYFVYLSLVFLPQDYNEKWNSYVGAYHYKIVPYKDSEPYWKEFYFLKYIINELTAFQLLIYLIGEIYLIWKAFRKENVAFWSNENAKLSWHRNLLFQLSSIGIIFILIRSYFSRDSGDHIIAAHVAFVIYAVSFGVIRRSVIYQNEKTFKKYEKSSLNSEIQDITLKKLDELMKKEKPFLAPDFSLPSLAKKLNVSSHHLSQILNEQLKQNFFEFTAQYRIQEAQNLLNNTQFKHLKMEEIAEKVGYNSKSAFNTAFKKIVGFTPSEYKKQLEK